MSLPCTRFRFCILGVVGVTRCISLEFWNRFLEFIRCYCGCGGIVGVVHYTTLIQ